MTRVWIVYDEYREPRMHPTLESANRFSEFQEVMGHGKPEAIETGLTEFYPPHDVWFKWMERNPEVFEHMDSEFAKSVSETLDPIYKDKSFGWIAFFSVPYVADRTKLLESCKRHLEELKREKNL